MNLTEHLEYDLLERYSMGLLAESETAIVEEHLVICSACCERCEETDQFVAAIRAAALRERNRPKLFVVTDGHAD